MQHEPELPSDLTQAFRGSNYKLETSIPNHEVDQYFNQMSGRHPLDDDGFPQKLEFYGHNFEDVKHQKALQNSEENGEQENAEVGDNKSKEGYHKEFHYYPHYSFHDNPYVAQYQSLMQKSVQPTPSIPQPGPVQIKASLETPCEDGDCCIVTKKRKKKKRKVRQQDRFMALQDKNDDSHSEDEGKGKGDDDEKEGDSKGHEGSPAHGHGGGPAAHVIGGEHGIVGHPPMP